MSNFMKLQIASTLKNYLVSIDFPSHVSHVSHVSHESRVSHVSHASHVSHEFFEIEVTKCY